MSQSSRRGITSRSLLAGIVFISILALASLFGPARSASAQVVPLHIVPTEPCSCSSLGTPLGPGESRMVARGQPFGQNYDEQLGISFTQSFTSIEYNVTAVEQTDAILGTGPAYLVNGLSNLGYWYQVGVSYDWSPGSYPGTGFDMNYEVFDTTGSSIFPTNGQGGVASFSGPVHEGDPILLDLYFTSSRQSVDMVAEDTVSGATATESYSSMGATYFAGLPDFVANSNGFFTGLMTEWYHGAPYFSNEATVVYSNPHFALTSAWLWIDEFNANSFQAVFSSNTSAPVPFTASSSKLQEFSYNGTTEFADAHEFVTGSLNGTSVGPTAVPLIFSYEVRGAGGGEGSPGFSPPILTYVANGSSRSTPLSGTPTAYYVDNRSEWSVSPSLAGSGPAQRWQTNQTTSGTTNASLSTLFVYFDQEDVTFGFSVEGSTSGYSPPTINYSSFGIILTASAGASVWADVGSRYQYTNPLTGSTSVERWFALGSGSVGPSQQVTTVYYLQYLVAFDVSFRNTEVFPPISLESTALGQSYAATLSLGANQEWLDSGASFRVPVSLSLPTGGRLLAPNASDVGRVASSNMIVSLSYDRQFYVEVTQDPSEGGTVSPPSGWYDSGTKIELTAVSSEGWQFQGWDGSGSDSTSGSNPSLELTVGPGSGANESASFYPGVTIHAAGPSSISYDDGTTSGTVQSGSTKVVYVPPSTSLRLVEHAIPFFTSFDGWSGAVNSSNNAVNLSVVKPVMVTAVAGFDYAGIGSLLIVVLLIAAVVGWGMANHRRTNNRRQLDEALEPSSFNSEVVEERRG